MNRQRADGRVFDPRAAGRNHGRFLRCRDGTTDDGRPQRGNENGSPDLPGGVRRPGPSAPWPSARRPRGAVPRCRRGPDGRPQLGGRAGERKPQVVVERVPRAERPALGEQQTRRGSSGHDGRRAQPGGQPAPQREPAGRPRHGPLGQPSAEFVDQQVAAFPELLPPVREDLGQPADQRGRGQLVEQADRELAASQRLAELSGERGVGAQPADPQPAPHRLGQSADRHRGRVGEAGGVRRHGVALQLQPGRHLVDDGEHPLLPEGGGQPASTGRRQLRTGGVGGVGHQVGQPGMALPRDHVGRGDEGVGIGRIDGDGGAPATGGRDRAHHAGVGRVLDEDPVARLEQRLPEQGRGVADPGRDDDLVGIGGQTAAGEPVGDRRPQRRQAARGVAVPVEVPRELGQGGLVRGEQLGGGLRCGMGEIEDAGAALRETPAGPRPGELGDGARAVAGGGEPLLAQHPVGRGDRDPAEVQLGRQLALGGEAASRRQVAGGEQVADTPGHPGVPRAGQALDRPEEDRQLASRGGPLLDRWHAGHYAEVVCSEQAGCMPLCSHDHWWCVPDPDRTRPGLPSRGHAGDGAAGRPWPRRPAGQPPADRSRGLPGAVDAARRAVPGVVPPDPDPAPGRGSLTCPAVRGPPARPRTSAPSERLRVPRICGYATARPLRRRRPADRDLRQRPRPAPCMRPGDDVRPGAAPAGARHVREHGGRRRRGPRREPDRRRRPHLRDRLPGRRRRGRPRLRGEPRAHGPAGPRGRARRGGHRGGLPLGARPVHRTAPGLPRPGRRRRRPRGPRCRSRRPAWPRAACSTRWTT